MRHPDLEHAAYTLVAVPPPYLNTERVEPLRLWRPEPGAVMLVDLRHPSTMTDARLRAVAKAIHTDFDVSLGLRVPSLSSPEGHGLAVRAHALGYRALLSPGVPIQASLYNALSSRHGLAEDVLAWIQRRQCIPAGASDIIRTILETAPVALTLEDVYRKGRLKGGTARRVLRSAGLPTPERWQGLSRMLNTQLDLIAEPDLTVSEAARACGYAHALSLNNRMTKLFGFGATTGRRLLGIEWRLAAWWRRYARPNPT